MTNFLLYQILLINSQLTILSHNFPYVKPVLNYTLTMRHLLDQNF